MLVLVVLIINADTNYSFNHVRSELLSRDPE